MKKLSKLIKRPSTQSLVLFDDVLDSEKLLLSPEIKKLVEYFYDNFALSVIQVENSERLHDVLREEQYRADVQHGAMIYPFKAHFDDLTLDTHSDEYSGPLYVQVFTPQESIFDVLTITCKWDDGLFKNDYYIVGTVVDNEDLQAILGKI